MTTAEDLRALFTDALAPTSLDVQDDSADHAGHAGSSGALSGTHFDVTIVSPRFEGRSLLERHRMVYDLVGARMKTGIHALALTLRTPQEHSAPAAR